MTVANTSDTAWIDAAEAARLLEVTRATLYAYVSRGFIRSQAAVGASRERRYSRDDVERLRRRTDARRDPDKAATHALRWGMPVLESAITLIDDDTLYYRGHDAVKLAQSRSLAEVVSLIWTGSFDSTLEPPHLDLPTSRPLKLRSREIEAPFIARAEATLADASTRDALAFDLRPDSVARTGWRILHLLAQVATQQPRHVATRADVQTIDRALASAWSVADRGVDVLRSALILCADHELNVSSFTARCVASANATPYAVVIAGLAALGGTKHGGLSARVESMLESLRRNRNLPDALNSRLSRGEPLYGFGHPLYRTGDPRATALLRLLRDRYPQSRELRFVETVAIAATRTLREHPTIDFALAAASRVLRLPPGSALTLFALGRTIGWIGHAIEQYATDQLIRPRARYVGVAPS